MKVEKFEKGNKRIKEELIKLKRDYVRMNDLIALCEEILKYSTPEKH